MAQVCRALRGADCGSDRPPYHIQHPPSRWLLQSQYLESRFRPLCTITRNAVEFNGLNNSISKHAANLRTKVFERIDAIELTSAGACEIQEDTTARELCHTLQKLICVSERYGLDSLSASCMDTITSLYKTHQLRPSADNILEIYSQTDPGSKLRLYVAQTLAYELVSKASEEGGNGNDEMSLIWGVMKENDELGVDVLVELAKMD